MNPLASSVTLQGVGDDDWVIIPHEEEGEEEQKAAPQSPSYGERYLNNRYLEVAVFGSREARQGTSALGEAYLSKTAYDKVMIPYLPARSLTGFLFGRYGED